MKSFSELTKAELYKYENASACCDAAELAGMLLLGSSISKNEIKFVTENTDVLGRFALLCRRLGFEAETVGETAAVRYNAVIRDTTRILMILNDFELIDPSTGIIRYRIAPAVSAEKCCRHALVRGAFMGGGTVIDPKKNYNLELITPYSGLSRDLSALLDREGFGFKTVQRKSKHVLYIKSSGMIQDFLSYIGAYKEQMELINIMIEKEIRNDFVRSINSESANLEKTIEASVRQIQAINVIDEKLGLDNLPEDLRTIAMLRLEHKSMSLSELGRQTEPPLGKSGVNRRLQKITELADRLSAGDWE